MAKFVRMFGLVITTLTLLLTIGTIQALNMKDSEEQPCFNISKTVPMDTEWIKSVKVWYYPMMTRLDLYRGAVDIANKDPIDIPEDKLYYESCITWKMNPVDGSFTMEGFHGQEVKYNVTLFGTGLESYEFGTENGIGNAGTCYTTLTDNKSFAVSAGCLKGNQMVWGVVSPYKALSEETIKLIHDHVESLGVKREYFTSLRYDSCLDSSH